MTTSPILRSSALQKALALVPPRASSTPGAFATTFAQVQSKTPLIVKPSPGRVTLAVVSVPNAIPFKDLITAAAKKYGVDPALLAGLVKQESNFNPNAKSGSGARGLTQLMDATARGLGVSDPLDPAQSLDGGARFLGGLLKQFHGDESLALAAYNAGPAAVQKYGGIPPYEETLRYVPKVLGYTTQYRRLWAGSSATPLQSN